jgi:hypothetical protein
MKISIPSLETEYSNASPGWTVNFERSEMIELFEIGSQDLPNGTNVAS